jgi:two-component system OmpR family sensor kinase
MKITHRLSAFFLAAMAVVLIGFSTAIYASAWFYLQRQVDDRLVSALAVLVAATEIHPDGVEWEPSERELTLGQALGPERLRWIVFDERGHRVDRSPNLDDATLTPAWTPAPGTTTLPARLRDRQGHVWKTSQRRLGSGQSAQGPGRYHPTLILTVAAPLDPINQTLAALGLILVGVSVAVWFVAALLGRWLVRRALAPLSRMVDSARQLNAAEPGWSLPSAGTDDELDELGRAFNDLLARLREAFERQRRFSGDASHQLRTPLTALIGQIEVALRRDRSPEEYRRVLGLLRGQAGGLVRIVESLLFLARAEAEAALPDSGPIELSTWLATHLGGHPRSELITLDAVGPAWVKAHPSLLGQLLDNLLDNAAKYGPSGGSIGVHVGFESSAVWLSVEDSGQGIEPADLPRVFEPFYRAERDRRIGRQGVGLGLSVVHRIATAFGGSVAVESRPGRGTRFMIRLPRAERVDADLRVDSLGLTEIHP